MPSSLPVPSNFLYPSPHLRAVEYNGSMYWYVCDSQNIREERKSLALFSLSQVLRISLAMFVQVLD